uniref:Lysophospholipid acyltransferase 5 n=1 Tax=Plectus sambesii TaxID=2011161 RepID=A0A914XMN2_9BILA
MGFLAETSQALAFPEDGMRLLISVLAGYPLAAIYRQFLYDKNKTIQYSYFTIVGIGIYLFNCGYETYHSMISVLLAYVICNFLPGTTLSVVLAHICFLGHLLIGYWFAESHEYDITWTTPFCIMTLRHIGLVMDVYDGKKRQDSLRPDQKATSVVNPPSLLETAAFSLFFSGTLVGPQFTLNRFRLFVNGEFLDPETKQPRASALRVSICRFLAGIFYAVIHQWGCVWIPQEYLNSAEFY